MASELRWNVESVECDKTTLVAVRLMGRFDAGNVSHARSQLTDLPESGSPHIIIDLSNLEWIDSSGVGVLVTMYKRARTRDGEVVVVGLNGQPREIFRLLRLDAAFCVCETENAAMAHFMERNGSERR